MHCMKIVQMRSLPWSLFSSICTEYGEMFVFVGENARLGPAHTTKLYVYL